MKIRTIAAPLACAGLLLTLFTSTASTADAADSYPAITGSGSSYASVPIFTWAGEVASEGLGVSFNPDGSSEGRQNYMQGSQVDFAASDVAFDNGRDKLAGTGAQVPKWGYDYLPLVADDVAFPYHLTVNGHAITNLRLSGQTLMEIFTGQITNWDNPAITKDYGHKLPSLPIIPVIHSDLAGTTYFFTSWLAREYPSQWNAFCDRVHPGIKPPCGPTQAYPVFGRAQAENGSANVVDYIGSPASNGAIGFDEYTYALSAGEPVLALRNAAGDYVRPTNAAVATALTAASINYDRHSPNYLQQNLDALYTFKNPASYPLSDYSYLIVPRAGTPLPPVFDDAIGRSLSVFIEYALCRGQDQSAGVGIAALPRNLVAAGLREIKLIPGHAPVPTLTACLAESTPESTPESSR
jgi:ABC-type phosphate transport system substrate-binding protein